MEDRRWVRVSEFREFERQGRARWWQRAVQRERAI